MLGPLHDAGEAKAMAAAVDLDDDQSAALGVANCATKWAGYRRRH